MDIFLATQLTVEKVMAFFDSTLSLLGNFSIFIFEVLPLRELNFDSLFYFRYSG